MVDVWGRFNCSYEKSKHSFSLYEDENNSFSLYENENNSLRLKSRFDPLETLNHDQKNPILLWSSRPEVFCKKGVL